MSDFLIEARSLTKRYGPVLAADHVTFKVPRGSVLGFLGPNGAGKSTTMKMLSCFMPPTSGTALVAGYDILDGSLDVRRRLGYLPESVPLYSDMRVLEYLRFRAKIKAVPRRERKSRIDYVLERCGIANVSSRIIGHLSKGYRQRVGLADALVHTPDVLIMDEPTVGLDPMQIREVRGLIKSLAEQHTVLLSTHILPEVEMICDRVVIIRRGRVVLQERLADLTSQGADRLSVELKAPVDQAQVAIGQIPGVRTVQAASVDGGELARLIVTAEKDLDLREAIYNKAVENGWALLELRSNALTLEDVFLQAVGGEEDAHEAEQPREEQDPAQPSHDQAESAGNDASEQTDGGETQ